ncbi:MAG: hypothetical protein J6V17_04465 [Bacteroidales bacterium]|nr:hypothetical protein [Bacteroidales bacterium]
MDIVITYVDGNDPVWKQDYEKYTDIPVMEKRFRDWGTLKYLLRGIENNMPFIRNVFLVVSHLSQVPQWVNSDNLKIVLHEDIIPERYRPTFNSTVIEMFLHRIDGLDEEFLYFNDDIFPVLPCRADDFFRDGRAVTGMSKHLFATSMYKKHVRRSDRLARETLGCGSSLFYVRPQHACIPVLKSDAEKIHSMQREAVCLSLTRVRSDENLNMSLFLSYMYHQGKVIAARQSCRHVSLAAASISKVVGYISSPERKLLCINDVKLGEARYQAYHDAIIEAFESRFPVKSKFEK